MKKMLISLSMFSVFTLGAIEANAQVFRSNIQCKDDWGNTVRGVAVGNESRLAGGSGIAIGDTAVVQAPGGIVIGNELTATRAGGKPDAEYFTEKPPVDFSQSHYEIAAWKTSEYRGAFTIGTENMTRQIVGVAAGSKATDAANVAQLINLQQYGDVTYATQKDFKVMGERVGVLETSMEALKDGFTIRAKNGYQEIRVRQGDVTMGGNRIQGVGDAVAATDAVNKRQLDNTARSLHKKINDVDKDMKAGVAMALAVAGLPQAYIPGKSMLAMSAGTYQGQSGFALGLSHATENRAWIVKGSATVDTRGNFGGSLGAGYQF